MENKVEKYLVSKVNEVYVAIEQMTCKGRGV